MQIETGIQNKALSLLLYGVEGIGKTTLISKAPNVLFLDTEGSTVRINTRRIKITSWEDLLVAVKYVLDNPTICKTLAIDTADWAEIQAIQYVCQKNRVASIENIPFGKGYSYVADEFSNLLKQLNALKEKGINIVFIAHAKPRKFELPEEMGQYDRYELKLSRQVGPLLKEWSDALLFCNYKIFVVTTESNSKKAQGGKRVIYTTHSPTYDAKNRFGLKDELDLDFKEISHLFLGEDVPVTPVTEEAPKEVAPVEVKERATITRIKEMLAASNITEDELKQVVADRGHYPKDASLEDYSDDFITRWIIPNWKKIQEVINKSKEGK